MELPAGFVFSPSNEHIFGEYLKPLMEGKQDAYLKVMYKTDEIYGINVNMERTFEKALTYHKQYVNEHVKDHEYLWFFTKLKRLGTSNRFERKSGEETWTISNTGPPIYEDKRESLIGRERSLALTVKVEEEEKGLQGIKSTKRKRVSASETKDVDNRPNWIMHEFFFEKEDGKQYTDYVIVKIRRKANTPSSSSSSQQVVRNEAAPDVRATQSTYQRQFQPSDYQHEANAEEYNWELPHGSIVDSLMEDQQGSHDDVPQHVLDSIIAELGACIDKPLVADDFRAVGEENAAIATITPSDYMHDTAAPTPAQDESQQGESNWDFYPDTLMEELLEASNVDIQQEVILISDSDDEAGPEERMDHEPVATDDSRTIEGDKEAAQHHNQEGLSDILVIGSEAEAQQDIRDEEFSECLLSKMQPEKEISDEDLHRSLKFWLLKSTL